MREPEILESLKLQVQRLYETAPHVHVTFAIARSKTKTLQISGTITGMYRRIFTVEEHDSKPTKIHSIQYTDLLTGLVRLDELNIPQE